MLLAPMSMPGRTLAVLWLSLCVAVLVFGFVQRSIHDMPVAFVWFLIFLSFPLGAAAVVAAAFATAGITSAAGIQYVPFWHELPMWFAAVVVGYWQWFILAPGLLRFMLRRRRRDASQETPSK